MLDDLRGNLRRTAMALVVGFAAIGGALGYWQLWRSADLASDLAGQIGADASEESRRNDRPCLHDVFGGRPLEPLAAYRALIDRSIEKREFAILHVLDRVCIDRRPIARNFKCPGLHWRCGCGGWRRPIYG